MPCRLSCRLSPMVRKCIALCLQGLQQAKAITSRFGVPSYLLPRLLSTSFMPVMCRECVWCEPSRHCKVALPRRQRRHVRHRHAHGEPGAHGDDRDGVRRRYDFAAPCARYSRLARAAGAHSQRVPRRWH